MGIFSRKPVTFTTLEGVIDRISDMGSDHIDFVIRLVGDRTLYRIFWNMDGRQGYSLYLAKPGDRVAMTVLNDREGRPTDRVERIVNHDY